MSLSYTTGNPSNLTAGATASMTDISGPFTDIKTFLTDGSGAIGDTILASPNNAVWTPLAFANGAANSTAGQITTTPSSFTNGGNLVASASATSTGHQTWTPPAAGSIDVAGKTTRLRIRVVYTVNATAPAITMTWGMYPVTPSGGATSSVALTLGTVVVGTTVSVASPSGGAQALLTGTSFDLSALSVGTFYVVGVVGSGTQAANSHITTSAILEMRHT